MRATVHSIRSPSLLSEAVGSLGTVERPFLAVERRAIVVVSLTLALLPLPIS